MGNEVNEIDKMLYEIKVDKDNKYKTYEEKTLKQKEVLDLYLKNNNKSFILENYNIILKYILDNNLKLDFLTKVKEISLSHENNSKNGFISVIVFITNIIFFASLIATILMLFI